MSDINTNGSAGRTFAANLKKLRKAKNVTQEQLGEAIKVKKSSISNYEQCVSLPDIPRALELAKVLQVRDLNQFFGYIPDTVFKEEDSDIRSISIVDTVSYGEDLNDLENVVDKMMLPGVNLVSGEFFGYLVPDNSMSRSGIKKGDIAIIRKQVFASTGDIVLIAPKGEPPLLRKLYLMDNNLALMPDSDTSGFMPKTYDMSKDDVQIFGRVYYLHGRY